MPSLEPIVSDYLEGVGYKIENDRKERVPCTGKETFEKLTDVANQLQSDVERIPRLDAEVTEPVRNQLKDLGYST